MAYGTVNLDKLVGSSGGTLSPDSGVFRNRIINGAMTVAQRGTSTTLPAGGSATYALDRWRGNAPISQNATVTQSSNAPTGFNYSYLYTVGTGSTNTGDQAETVQFIEGYNFADFGFGASGASTFTISFWVKSSITGSYGIAFENIDSTRTYSTTYTISSANTWEQKTLTIAGDTTGTWDKTTGRGLNIFFDLGHGTAQSQNATNAWANSGGTGTYRGVNGVVKLTQTTGATWQITGVQLEKGSTATSFDYRDYGRELIMCQRYFQKSYAYSTLAGATGFDGVAGRTGTAGSGSFTGGEIFWCLVYPVAMRTTPTFSMYDSSGNAGKCTRTAFGVADYPNQAVDVPSGTEKNAMFRSTTGTSAGAACFHYYSTAEL